MGTNGGNCIWQLSYSLEGEELKKQINQDSPECSPLAVPAFFCSDVDIHEMKKMGSCFLDIRTNGIWKAKRKLSINR